MTEKIDRLVAGAKQQFVDESRDGVVAPQVVIDAGHDPAADLQWFHSNSTGRGTGPSTVSSLGSFADGWQINLTWRNDETGEPVEAYRHWYAPGVGIGGDVFVTETWDPVHVG